MFNELNLLKIFFEEPTREFNVREFARILKIAPATASKQLEVLTTFGLLSQRKDRLFHFYKANLDNEFYRDVKIFYNLRKIKDSGLLDQLNDFYLKPTLVLFGSFASGLDTETSDIDLFIFSENVKEFDKREQFQKKLKREIQIFVEKDIKHIKNKHLINNLLNGIVLQGKLKWI